MLPEICRYTTVGVILRTPVASLRYWRHLGTGPHSFRLGRRVLYRYTDVIERLRPGAAEPGPVAKPEGGRLPPLLLLLVLLM